MKYLNVETLIGACYGLPLVSFHECSIQVVVEIGNLDKSEAKFIAYTPSDFGKYFDTVNEAVDYINRYLSGNISAPQDEY